MSITTQVSQLQTVIDYSLTLAIVWASIVILGCAIKRTKSTIEAVPTYPEPEYISTAEEWDRFNTPVRVSYQPALLETLVETCRVEGPVSADPWGTRDDESLYIGTSYRELQRLCKDRGLSAVGRASALRSRLVEWRKEAGL